ncbi:superoxide dismutase [Brevundimonas kwangchunensis]
MRKTALLTGVAGLLLMTAPAFAQDSTAPQTPPAPAEQPAQEAAPQSLTLNPGQTIVSSDGQDLGQLVGARNGDAGQELTVRGADGSVRAVPTTGISQQGEKVAVGWTAAEFQAAPPIADESGVPAAEPSAPPAPVDPSAASEPSSVEPATPPSEPMSEPTPEPAPAEPEA